MSILNLNDIVDISIYQISKIFQMSSICGLIWLSCSYIVSINHTYILMILYMVFFLFCFRQHFGCDHPKYADTLIDYGYYLLNVDAINLSVKVYKVRTLPINL